jgi:hypothetical protein
MEGSPKVIIQTDKPLRPRADFDFYPTPGAVVTAALELIPTQPETILDLGAGLGPFGYEARSRWPLAAILGVEVQPLPCPEAYDGWINASFPECRPEVEVYGPFDAIIGNPPYRQAEEFIHHSLDLLAVDGWLVLLLRLAFLEGQRRRTSLYHQYPPHSVHVCSKRPSFTGDGKTDATAYAVFCWSKCWRGTPALKWLKETHGT